MITLTAEQAQQIEEALLPYAYQYVEMGAAYTVTKSDALVERALTILRAARAQEQAEKEPVAFHRASFLSGYEAAQSDANACDVPPQGWICTRQAGHDGPCAAIEDNNGHELVSRAMSRLAEQDAAPVEPVKQEQAEQPVSQEYQDHLVNQSFDWAAMAAKHQFMEGYRIGLAEMREKCAKVAAGYDATPWKHCQTSTHAADMVSASIAAAIRAINFEGDTGFRPVSEMIAEHKQDPKKAAAIEKAKMRKAEQEPVAWMHKCGGVCSAYDKEHMFGLDYFNIPLYAAQQPVQDIMEAVDAAMAEMQNINPPLRRSECERLIRAANYAAPVQQVDLTDYEIVRLYAESPMCDSEMIAFARAVIAADRELNR